MNTVTRITKAGSREGQSNVMPLRVRQFQSHELHRGYRVWQETNCYVDLWIELLHSYGLDPCAALGFTVTQDFEGDQFTVCKFPLENLDQLYGIQVRELAIYDSLEDRVQTQIQRGHVVLAEVDGFYLPDTQGKSYRREHKKTTIGMDYINTRAGRLGYFHNTGYFLLSGEDYGGLFGRQPNPGDQRELLSPYVEFSKRVKPPLRGTELAEASADLLVGLLGRRPAYNPIQQWRASFPKHVDTILERGEDSFHLYSFNVMRQLGSNFELLAKHLVWLRAQGFDIPEVIPITARKIASASMEVQLRLSQTSMRRHHDLCEDCFDILEASYDKVLESLVALVR